MSMAAVAEVVNTCGEVYWVQELQQSEEGRLDAHVERVRIQQQRSGRYTGPVQSAPMDDGKPSTATDHVGAVELTATRRSNGGSGHRS